MFLSTYISVILLFVKYIRILSQLFTQNHLMASYDDMLRAFLKQLLELLLVPVSSPGDLSPQVVFCKIWKFLSSVSLMKTIDLRFTQSREWILKHFLVSLFGRWHQQVFLFQGKSVTPWDLKFLHFQTATDNSLYPVVDVFALNLLRLSRWKTWGCQELENSLLKFCTNSLSGSPCHHSRVIICRRHYRNGWLYQLNHIYSKWMHSIFC